VAIEAHELKLRSLTLYVLRHGECVHNVEGWVGSHDDSPLTSRGREQARGNGRLLRELLGNLSSVDFFSSSLHRACTTIELILDELSLPTSHYRADHRLMEIHAGDHIGIRWSDMTPRDHEAKRTDPWNYRRDGGESEADVYARVDGFLRTLRRDGVIVTHAIPARMIRAHYLGISGADATQHEQRNAGVLRLAAGTEACFDAEEWEHP
jgi:probable phosphoglycerate mutase